jgi:hypothetical protein
LVVVVVVVEVMEVVVAVHIGCLHCTRRLLRAGRFGKMRRVGGGGIGMLRGHCLHGGDGGRRLAEAMGRLHRILEVIVVVVE